MKPVPLSDGDTAYVRALTFAQVRALLKGEEDEFDTSLVLACLCDASGQPLLTQDDREQVNNWCGADATRVHAAALEINGLMQPQDETAKNS